MDTPLSRQATGQAGLDSAERRGRGCARPVRLVGSTMVVNTSTGEVGHRYSSSQELDGTTYVRCGNRRAEVCPSCSAEYNGDAWHLVLCGLAGGKGILESVADHPCTFATFTAPSFGPLHGVRQKGPCRARRDKPVCEHGRPLRCNARHHENDRRLGTPLCADCYDYTGHRGHPITKSRAYSVTFGQIRRVRRRFRHNPAGLDPEADIRQILDVDEDLPEGFEVVSSWVFVGQGYLDLDTAAAAVYSAALARTR